MTRVDELRYGRHDIIDNRSRDQPADSEQAHRDTDVTGTEPEGAQQMKLMRVGAPGSERPVALDAERRYRDLSGHVADIDGDSLDQASLATLTALDLHDLPIVDAGRIGPCVGSVGKFIGIGLNYSDHAREANLDIPSEPIIFHKATSCICGPNDPIVLPRGATKTDWEVELGIVIGTTAQYVDTADARQHVAGFCLVNDVSERAFQIERGGNWTKGKSADSFGPIGPWMVTSDEVPDPHVLALELSVNGEVQQSGNTANMIFDVDVIVSYVSQFMTLHPGDVITTGTPAGVGMGFQPPRFLGPGDVVRLSITGLGEQSTTVIDHSETSGAGS